MNPIEGGISRGRLEDGTKPLMGNLYVGLRLVGCWRIYMVARQGWLVLQVRECLLIDHVTTGKSSPMNTAGGSPIRVQRCRLLYNQDRF